MYELSAVIEIEIPFHDVDAMQVAWHGRYLKYFEQARCALLRRFNYDYPQMRESGYLWPIVECNLKYIHPAMYGQRIRTEARLLEYECRLKFGYEIRDALNGKRLCRGSTIQVAVEEKTRELQFVTPAIVLANLEKACAR